MSSAGLSLESDSSNERVLGFQSGGTQPPPARLPGELSADAECLEPGGLDRAPFSKGLKIPET